jgi:Putative zinc dependent peptidase (DUF5700)
MGRSGRRQEVSFNCSAINACICYLKSRTDENLQRLLSTPGCKLAYKHHLWSSPSSGLTIREFWKKELKGIEWREQLGASIEEIIQYLKVRESDWIEAVLRYLPRGHVFETTVYLIGGYDNIVYGEDIALNLNFEQFHLDHREAVYYLIHELAHAGYFRYRQMPDLANLKTLRGLLESVRLLTHLEGMGVISPFKLRRREGGLLDDYKTLLDRKETEARVRDYFVMLSNLEDRPNRKLQRQDYQILDDFSARPKRLWYITGGHMASKIEERCGIAKLQNTVREGHEAFFRAYAQIENSAHSNRL